VHFANICYQQWETCWNLIVKVWKESVYIFVISDMGNILFCGTWFWHVSNFGLTPSPLTPHPPPRAPTITYLHVWGQTRTHASRKVHSIKLLHSNLKLTNIGVWGWLIKCFIEKWVQRTATISYRKHPSIQHQSTTERMGKNHITNET
jgi:hypothetical protein